MYWMLGIFVYIVLLAATVLFFAGCGKLNEQADRQVAEMVSNTRTRERRAA